MEDNTNKTLDSRLATSVAALLKLEPLIGLDPNDQDGLLELVEKAHHLAIKFELNTTAPEILKRLALALNQWGEDFHEQAWVETILTDPTQSIEDRIDELYLYVRFQSVGPDAVDFSTYSILTYKRANPETDYTNKQIHIASQMALEISQTYEIDDLINTYACVMFILITGVDFINDSNYKPIKELFENKKLSATEKVQNSIKWMTDNIDRINELSDV